MTDHVKDGLVEVIQADIDAVVSWDDASFARDVDYRSLIEAFARHRVAATSEASLSVERMRGEVAYLLARASDAGRCRFGGHRWTGMSSNAISAVAFGQDDPGDMPSDSSDLAACYETLKRLPKHLLTDAVERRLQLAEEFVSARYDDAVADAREYAEWPGFAALNTTAVS